MLNEIYHHQSFFKQITWMQLAVHFLLLYKKIHYERSTFNRIFFQIFFTKTPKHKKKSSAHYQNSETHCFLEIWITTLHINWNSSGDCFLLSFILKKLDIEIIFEAGAMFDNSLFDNSFVLVRQLKNRSFLGSVFVHVTGQTKN